MEIMVAMVILLIVVMIVSAIFHQSSIAWDGGMRKARGNMTARAAFGLMRRDIEAAVNDTLMTSSGGAYGTEVFYDPGAGNVLDFVKVSSVPVDATGSDDSTLRSWERVRYAYDQTSLSLLRKTARYKDDQSDGWTMPQISVSASDAIATNVHNVFFLIIKDRQLNAPSAVNVRMALIRPADVSHVRAVSAGPDGSFGKDDDNIGP
jgi:hypothetical protein